MTPVCTLLEYESHLQLVFRRKQWDPSVWVWGSEKVAFPLLPPNLVKDSWRDSLREALCVKSGVTREVSRSGTDVQIIRFFGSSNYGYHMFLSYLDKTLIPSAERQKRWCVCSKEQRSLDYMKGEGSDAFAAIQIWLLFHFPLQICHNYTSFDSINIQFLSFCTL